jgi:hypothetical protein
MSKDNENTNGSDQKGTEVEERASGRRAGQPRAPANQSTLVQAPRSDEPSPIERRFAEELDRLKGVDCSRPPGLRE